jgi:hypothetical protein
MIKQTTLIGSKVVSMLIELDKEIEIRDNRYRKYRLKKDKSELEAMLQWRAALIEVVNTIKGSEKNEEELIRDIFSAGFKCKKKASEEEEFNAFIKKEFTEPEKKEEDAGREV